MIDIEWPNSTESSQSSDYSVRNILNIFGFTHWAGKTSENIRVATSYVCQWNFKAHTQYSIIIINCEMLAASSKEFCNEQSWAASIYQHSAAFFNVIFITWVPNIDTAVTNFHLLSVVIQFSLLCYLIYVQW